jgi:RNA polymerase sigma factor (sigma-70 family)
MTDAGSATATYRAHAAEVTRFATALVGPDAAADVVADAVVSLLGDGGLDAADNPRALLYRAVLAKARSAQRSGFRRRARERRVAQRLVAFQPEIRPEVVAAVVRLSPQQRACVFLTYWEDLSIAEVAERLAIGAGTVKR